MYEYVIWQNKELQEYCEDNYFEPNLDMILIINSEVDNFDERFQSLYLLIDFRHRYFLSSGSLR